MKSIDLYLIAGQSNASGYTCFSPSQLHELWEDCFTGSPQVLYSGRAESTTASGTTYVNEVSDWIPVVAGLGRDPAHIGPEVGMAKVLAAYYTGNRTAGILKCAHGGTSLLNKVVGENAANGNWVSPSYAECLCTPHEGLVGGMYRNLLEEVRSRVAGLRDFGYTSVRLKGMFWMQGESDRAEVEEYKKAFRFFVCDLRRDLGKILGEDLSDFAILIGEISETQASASPASVAVNKAFIAAQRELAAEDKHLYMVASSQFSINRMENGREINDQDPYHWTTEPMLRIGELVGKCITEHLL